MAEFGAGVKVTFTGSKKVYISCLKARRLPGQSVPNKKLLMQVENMLSGGGWEREREIVPETPVLTP